MQIALKAVLHLGQSVNRFLDYLFSLTSFILPESKCRFPVSSLCDGQWHQVSLGVSPLWLEVYVDCALVERVNWAYPWQDIATDGLLMLGGILEGFEIPFEVRKCAH